MITTTMTITMVTTTITTTMTTSIALTGVAEHTGNEWSSEGVERHFCYLL